MDNNVFAGFKAFDRSYLAILKKDIHTLAAKAGFKEARLGECDIVVSELAGNLVKHADDGILFAKPIQADHLNGIELISIDKGPGMQDISRMMADGMSTKNTLGQGLGAIKRLSDFFQVYSQKDWGTIMVVRLFDEKPPQFKKAGAGFVTGSLLLPKTGETECGDAFFYKQDEDYYQFFLADGLGHGHEAAEAVKRAGDAFEICIESDPPEIIRYISASTRKTRGLVGTVVVFDRKETKWRICGVGNIMTKIMSPFATKTHIAYNGIIGLNVPNTLNAMEMEYDKEQLLIMCSDGIRSRWDLSKYPGIFRYDLSVLAATIFKDFNRGTDDASVVATRINL